MGAADAYVSWVIMGAACIVLCIALWRLQQTPILGKEGFVTGYNDTIDYTNTGPEPWNHHPVNAMPLMDTALPLRYQKAYYFELDNSTFEIALGLAFNLPNTAAASDIEASESWEPLSFGTGGTCGSDCIKAYTAAKEFLATTLVRSASLFRLPDGTSPPLQVIHDVLIQAACATNNKNKYLMYIDFVLYREAKYQAKSIRTVCIVELPNGLTPTARFLEMNVTGVISEGDFGLFPVTGVDPSDDAASLGPVPQT